MIKVTITAHANNGAPEAVRAIKDILIACGADVVLEGLLAQSADTGAPLKTSGLVDQLVRIEVVQAKRGALV